MEIYRAKKQNNSVPEINTIVWPLPLLLIAIYGAGKRVSVCELGGRAEGHRWSSIFASLPNRWCFAFISDTIGSLQPVSDIAKKSTVIVVRIFVFKETKRLFIILSKSQQ